MHLSEFVVGYDQMLYVFAASAELREGGEFVMADVDELEFDEGVYSIYFGDFVVGEIYFFELHPGLHELVDCLDLVVPEVEVPQLPQVLQVGDSLDLVVAEVKSFQFYQPVYLFRNASNVVVLE